ncbi:hypothetical protein [Geomonas subterranea]
MVKPPKNKPHKSPPLFSTDHSTHAPVAKASSKVPHPVTLSICFTQDIFPTSPFPFSLLLLPATAVAVGSVVRLAAVAQVNLLLFFHFEGYWRMVRADMCPVAKGDSGGFTAGTAVVGTCFEFYDDRLVRCEGGIAHLLFLLCFFGISPLNGELNINLFNVELMERKKNPA